MAIWESTQKRIEEIRTLTKHSDMSEESGVIVDLPSQFCPEWVAGEAYVAGQLVAYNGVKYLILQPVTAQEHYPPEMSNGAMLAIYKPYQGREGNAWLYGEYIEIGFTRYDNGVLYRAIQDPGANIFPPSQVPAVWETVAK